MDIHVKNIQYKLTFIVFFFTFVGYYATLLLVSNFLGLEFSRLVTVPVRVLILFSLLLLFIINIKKLKKVRVNLFFLIFSFFYFLRLAIDYNTLKPYYISISEVLTYFLGFCFLPYLILSTIKLNKRILNALFDALFYGGLLFSILVLVYYGKYIGTVSRLTSGMVNESVLSPLALSYSSILVIVVFLFYLLNNKVSRLKKIMLIIGVVLSVIPFFLGASRGSILVLIISFLVYFLTSSNSKILIKNLVFGIALFFVILFLDTYFNSGLISRFTNTTKDVEDNNSSAARLEIWKNAIEQFSNNILIGDKLEVNGYIGYAHNLIIESLQTTGILGTIPLIVLLIYIWTLVFKIAKENKEYFWVLVIFIQAFIQAMFSGSLYMSSWLWISMAIILGLNYYIKRINLCNIRHSNLEI